MIFGFLDEIEECHPNEDEVVNVAYVTSCIMKGIYKKVSCMDCSAISL